MRGLPICSLLCVRRCSHWRGIALVLLQWLGISVGVELPSRSSIIAAHGGSSIGSDTVHIMRTEPVAAASQAGGSRRRTARRPHGASDRVSEVAVHMLGSGALSVLKDASPPLTQHASRHSSPKGKAARSAQSLHAGLVDIGGAHSDPATTGDDGEDVDDVEQANTEDEAADGFQDHGDLDRTDRGYAWRRDHDARDEANDDDWDDEDTHGSATFGTNASYPDDDESEDGSETFDAADAPIVNVTAEEDASAPADKGPLKATNPKPPQAPPPENDVEKLGEGIGAMAYERAPTGSRSFNYEIRKRLQLQDVATIGLLLAVFALTVMLSCCSVYQVAEDPSPAAYYSQPKFYHQSRVICDSADVDAFLTAFNTQPQNVRLRIIGWNPEPGGFRRFLRTLNAHSARSRGLANLLPMRQRRRLPILFDVALDLAPFITGDGRLSDDNLAILQKYLNTKNRLETLLIQKRVDWPVWEDVATNIRQRLRTLGFPGDVEVRFEAHDEILIYQNHKWSNFVRNRVTQALVVISIVGSAFWLPYVWFRSKTTKVETRFRINVDPSRYWELVSEGLSAAEGFQSM